ncbi:MAG TPA: TIM barrel protein, partial [Pirellulales bacterium]|nr:TIM barrel protein [Pirellulales bacterium]
MASRKAIGSQETLPPGCSRRTLLSGAVGAAAAIAGWHAASPSAAAADDAPAWKVEKDQIHSSICRWCFNPHTIEEMCQAAQQIGLRSVELLSPEELPKLKPFGLTCAMVGSHGFVKGLNHTENHEECIAKITHSLDAAAEHGCPNVITFSGMRKGLSNEEGIKNTVAGIKKVIGHAEKKGVNLAFEVLNSRVNVEMKGHPDYQG